MMAPSGLSLTLFAAPRSTRDVLWAPWPVPRAAVQPAAATPRGLTPAPAVVPPHYASPALAAIGRPQPLARGGQAPLPSPCDAPANAIVAENCLPGSPQSEWDLSDAADGNVSIQGFATDISIDKGETVAFKVDTNSLDYRLDIYRMGYYGGLGARKVATVVPSLTLPAGQPDCLTEPATGLVDCGNWAVTASWDTSDTATFTDPSTPLVSGIYFAKAIRENDPDLASHIFFVVRDDAGGSDLLFQTSDTTWQAYNDYGGNSLYTGAPVGRAFKVSYNRPFVTRAAGRGANLSWVFSAEYPMVRWLEAGGYDVSYLSGIDTDRRGGELLEHKVFLSVGHDEYWSRAQRANVEAARDAQRTVGGQPVPGVHLAFFSGNEVFWKIRWENSRDGSNTPYRTMVSYKETASTDGQRLDTDPEWTGTWRDGRDFNPQRTGPGGTGVTSPENALTGQLFMVNGERFDGIIVPAEFARHRFWRNTAVAALQPGAAIILPQGTLGYEWDEVTDNGFSPPGLQRLSKTIIDVWPKYLLDEGTNYGLGTATHSLSLYQSASGATVFGAGTVQWSWGLDNHHDNPGELPSLEMQQATVNLLLDMGVSPATPAGNIALESKPADITPPSSVITSPTTGSGVQNGEALVIEGTASDTFPGHLAGLEVSTDGGTTWRAATLAVAPDVNGLTSWTFEWVATGAGTTVLKSRAVDDSGNVEVPGAGVSLTVARNCPCSLWSDAATPAVIDRADPSAIELGVRFMPTTSGTITGIRFYKSGNNAGPHVGHLWNNSGGTPLATVTFDNETPSGWQEASFSQPVAVVAGTLYIASYFAPNGHYSIDRLNDTTVPAPGFSVAVDNTPLYAPRDGEHGPNGLFAVGGGFPSLDYQATNYWVDVVFMPDGAADAVPPVVTGRTPAPGTGGHSPYTNITVRFSEPLAADTVTGVVLELQGPGGVVPAQLTYLPATRTVVLDPTGRLADNTVYSVILRAGGITDVAGNGLPADVTWTFTTATPIVCPCTLWTPQTVPSFLVNNSDDGTAVTQGVELGVKFRADVDGFITGIRFYKSLANQGMHVATLWRQEGAGGVPLATATFVAETDDGWQEVLFTEAVAITANTTYVASYHAPQGRYAVNRNFFLPQFVSQYTRPPLRALVNGEDGPNGVYKYGASGYPTETFLDSNYWVDVVFHTEPPPDITWPTIVERAPVNAATNVTPFASVTVRFSEAIDPATLTATTLQMTRAAGIVDAALVYDPATFRATLAPDAALADETVYTVTVRGGAGGVRDLAGNALAADESWSFTTGAAQECPCTIWPADVPAPQIVDIGSLDPGAGLEGITLGVRFRAEAPGAITAIRFYRSAANVGLLTVMLWESDGTLRRTATVDVPAGQPEGWMEVPIAPFSIQAHQTYVASYHMPPTLDGFGHYSVTRDYFTAAQAPLFTRPPLAALPDTEQDPQGLFAYGGGFPTDGFQKSNYWVDVVFSLVGPTAPQAAPDAFATPEDVPLTVAADQGVLANDTDVNLDVLQALLVTGPAYGALLLEPDGSLSYTPAPDFNGTDTFTYQASDGALASAVTTVTITVHAVNDAPVASDDSATTTEETAVSGNVLANDADVDAATLTAVKLTDPLNGVATLAGDGSFTYTPAPNFSGVDNFTYRASDGTATSNAATVTITIGEVNDAPTVAAPIVDVSVAEDAATTDVSLATTFADVEGSASLTLTVAGNSNPALVAATLTGTNLALDYVANATGTATITMRATDGGGLFVEDSFVVTVTPVNDLPTISDITDRSIVQGSTTGALAFTVGDLETPAASLTPSGTSSNTTLVPNGNIVFGGGGTSRTVTVTPAAGQSGSATITITITDANGGSAADTFALTVTAIASTATTTPTTSQPSTTYGTSVTFTSTVTVTPGGAPVTSGSVTFFDGGVALGSANVNGSGVASLATTMVDVGTRAITAAYGGTASFAASTSPGGVTQTVSKATAASTLTVSPLAQQYSDVEVFEVTVTGANGGAPAQGVTFRIGTQTMNGTPVAFVSQGGGVWKARATLPLLESGTAGQLRPNATPKIVAATLNTISPNYTLGNPSSKSMTINKEDARVAYTGPAAVSTGGATGTTIPLRAVVSDISSTPEANGDVTPGDLRLAQVQFINRATGLVIATVVADAAGVATHNWAVDIGANASQAFTVGFIVTNYYNRSNVADNAVITVSK